MTNFLYQEWQAARSRRPELTRVYKLLARYGITHHHRAAVGGLGCANVTLHSDGLYEPAPPGCGEPALIYAVFDGPPDDPASRLIDLLAAHRLDCWALRTGNATILGSVGSLPLAEPLTVHENPWQYLAAGGDGVLVLDWHAARRTLPLGYRPILAKTVAHGRALRRRLTIPAIVPEVKVMGRVAA